MVKPGFQPRCACLRGLRTAPGHPLPQLCTFQNDMTASPPKFLTFSHSRPFPLIEVWFLQPRSRQSPGSSVPQPPRPPRPSAKHTETRQRAGAAHLPEPHGCTSTPAPASWVVRQLRPSPCRLRNPIHFEACRNAGHCGRCQVEGMPRHPPPAASSVLPRAHDATIPRRSNYHGHLLGGGSELALSRPSCILQHYTAPGTRMESQPRSLQARSWAVPGGTQTGRIRQDDWVRRSVTTLHVWVRI